MSLDAGGLAQMTYNHNPLNGSLGLPTSGFASRGKGANIKRLSVAPPSSISTIDENQPSQLRTSRSHLLAGLRTAPKSPAVPISAPPTQLQHNLGPSGTGLHESRFANVPKDYSRSSAPKTSTTAAFPASYRNVPSSTASAMHAHAGMNSLYSPEQILAPPSIQFADENGESTMDPRVYEELLRTNQYLAEQQMRLQQQLINVTAAARQFGSFGGANAGAQAQAQVQAQAQAQAQAQVQAAFGQTSMNLASSIYSQQLQNGVQPVIEPVTSQPGLYTVYNPLTGQSSYFFDQNAASEPIQRHQQQQVQQQPQQYQQLPQKQQHHHQQQQHQLRETPKQSSVSSLELSNSPPPPTPTFRAQVSPPPEQTVSSPIGGPWRSNSPPKTSPSPPRDEAASLPQHSAIPYRPGHRKGLSLIKEALNPPASDGPKTAGLKSAGFPPTPMTGTFGPGQAREGEHPIRQPRGPPSLEELVAKPTSKFEGSKNFATRQRRRAVNNLVRAGLERRTGRGSGSSADSPDSGTPTSERDSMFSPAPEFGIGNLREAELGRSGSASLSGKPSFGNLRASPVSAIGSERAELRSRDKEQRGSVDSYTASSVSSDDGACIGGRLVEIRADGATGAAAAKDDREVGMGKGRKAALVMLAGPEQRRSFVF